MRLVTDGICALRGLVNASPSLGANEDGELLADIDLLANIEQRR